MRFLTIVARSPGRVWKLCEVDPIVWTKFRQSLDGVAG
jgi:hypothetical protein